MSIDLSRFVRTGFVCLGSLALLSSAGAATERWESSAFSPTGENGLEVGATYFEGHKILDSMAVPFFVLDGSRYDLQEGYRVGGVDTIGQDGGAMLEATYRVPTSLGDVTVTVTHRLQDHDSQYDDLGELSSRVRLQGPSGEYTFYWRIDPDLEGAGGDRVQVFTSAGRRGYWAAPELERAIDLDVPAATAGSELEFDRFKVRFVEGPDPAHQVQLRLQGAGSGDAVAFVKRNHPAEWNVEPSEGLNGERLQKVTRGEPIPQPISGSDNVLWYRTTLTSSEGEAGPDLYATVQAGRNAVIEIDRMASTQYPTATTVLQGETVSVQSAFAAAGITINELIEEGVMPDKNKVSMAELDAIMEENITYQETMDTPTQWYSWFGLVKKMYMPGVLGIMADYYEYSSDDAYREGAFAFYDIIAQYSQLFPMLGYPPQDANQWLMYTVTHETGHAYNQHHEDYWYEPNSCFYEDSTIMGYSFDVTNHLYWSFGPNSNGSMRSDPEEYVRPGHGVDFVSDGEGLSPYNATPTHKQGHHWTGEFSGGGCMFGMGELLDTETARSIGIRPEEAWSLKIDAVKDTFLLGEPVVFRVSLENIGGRPLEAAPLLQPEYHAAIYRIERPDGSWTNFEPAARYMVAPPTLIQTFEPGEAVSEEVKLFTDRSGWTFDDPGEYKVQVVFTGHHPDSARIYSNTYSFQVLEGNSLEQAAADLMMQGEPVLLMQWEQGDHLKDGLETLRRVARDYPTTSLAKYAHFVLGSVEASPFFNGVSERPARPAKAIPHLEVVRQALMSGNWESSSLELPLNVTLRLASSYQQLGQADKSRAVLNEFVRFYRNVPEMQDAITRVKAELH